jgi:glucokinase
MAYKRQLISADVAEPPFFVGVDLGGTNIKMGVVDSQGRPVAYGSMPTEVSKGPQEGVRRMARTAEALLQQAGLDREDIARLGLGSPGTMDLSNGMLLEPHNLPGWFHFPIRDELARECGKPVTFANDAGAAAYGEFWCGTGRDFQSLILLTLGTGVGGGIIHDGISIDGRHGHGAECGHIIIDLRSDARVCPCGGTGHLEAYASATAVVERTREALAAGGSTSLAQRLRDGQALTPLLLAQEAEAGDRLALELIDETARYLGVGVVSLMHTIDPDGVVLGGAMTFGGHGAELGRRFLRTVQDEVRRRAFPVLADQVIIDFASLGVDAGFIGAAGLARAEFLRQ